MTSNEIRQRFLDFFASKGHTVVSSSSLIPGNDPTLLFTNAGMVQFKDVFTGQDKRSYVRAVSSQRCVRAGGKHNDLENVGYTARHHTFFEMLGNFSFGDYFKRNAIQYAWEFLTEDIKLPKEKLWVTVYAEDDEAYDIWANEIGVPKERIVRIGDNKGAKYASDNFWAMGDTGPCGPCSEIFYDHGADIPGGPPGSPDEDGDRYIEIWNNVFMQFNRDEAGVMHPLPKPSVDTGMGLERISAVLQHVHSNYEIDIFQALIKAAKSLIESAQGKAEIDSPSLKVMADHIRACSFLISDGVIPDKEGRGYVLRRIIRRAIRHAYKLGARAPVFWKLCATLINTMGDAYPELRTNQHRISNTLQQEEERFFETIANGMSILEMAISDENFAIRWLEKKTGWKLEGLFVSGYAGMPYQFDGRFNVGDKEIPVVVVVGEDDKESLNRIYQSIYTFKEKSHLDIEKMAVVYIGSNTNRELSSLISGAEFPIQLFTVTPEELNPFKVLSSEVAFKLHDTYGFPLDLTADVCREHGVSVDEAGFNAAMERQREQARAAGKFKAAGTLEYSGQPTTFHGYDSLNVDAAKITAIYVDGSETTQLNAGQSGIVVLDNTPFYAESGGQVGDTGLLQATGASFEVADTQKIRADVFGHQGVLKQGALKVGDTVAAKVDGLTRARVMRNHSATHLMHKALREVLGDHVQQKGSLVDAEKTRFDFVHTGSITAEQIRTVEDKVNAEILQNLATQARVLPIEEARKTGAMMLFGEKYGDEVRVLDIGSSRELCGGTHVMRTGDIGLFKILMEGGVAAGVRRVEAITGDNAVAYLQNLDGMVKQAAAFLKAQPSELPQKIGQVQDQLKALEKELAALKGKLAASQSGDLAAQAVDIGGIKVLAAQIDGDAQALRETADKLKNKLGTCALVLGTASDDKVSLVAMVSADAISRIKAGELVNFVASQVGGKGGGRPDMAQAGGTQPDKLASALESVASWVGAKLN